MSKIVNSTVQPNVNFESSKPPVRMEKLLPASKRVVLRISRKTANCQNLSNIYIQFKIKDQVQQQATFSRERQNVKTAWLTSQAFKVENQTKMYLRCFFSILLSMQIPPYKVTPLQPLGYPNPSTIYWEPKDLKRGLPGGHLRILY